MLTGGTTPPPLLDPAPDWDRPGDPANFSQFLVLWHGCTSWDLSKIRSNPSLIGPRVGRVDSDFGQGFYTTSVKRQARHWAWTRYYDIPASARGPTGIPLQPVVLKFRLKLEDMRLSSRSTSCSVITMMSDFGASSSIAAGAPRARRGHIFTLRGPTVGMIL